MSKRLAIIVAAPALLSSFALMPVVQASPSTHAGNPKLGPVGAKHLHVVSPNSYYCDPGWIYDSVSDRGRQMYPTTVVYSDYNGTPYNATATFSATTAGWATLTTTIGGSADANVIVAGVDVSLNISVAVTLYASTGNAIAITVPPYKTGNGQHGVWRKVAYGHYYYLMSNCAIGTDKGWVTSYSPWTVGWNTWLS